MDDLNRHLVKLIEELSEKDNGVDKATWNVLITQTNVNIAAEQVELDKTAATKIELLCLRPTGVYKKPSSFYCRKK